MSFTSLPFLFCSSPLSDSIWFWIYWLSSLITKYIPQILTCVLLSQRRDLAFLSVVFTLEGLENLLDELCIGQGLDSALREDLAVELVGEDSLHERGVLLEEECFDIGGVREESGDETEEVIEGVAGVE